MSPEAKKIQSWKGFPPWQAGSTAFLTQNKRVWKSFPSFSGKINELVLRISLTPSLWVARGSSLERSITMFSWHLPSSPRGKSLWRGSSPSAVRTAECTLRAAENDLSITWLFEFCVLLAFPGGVSCSEQLCPSLPTAAAHLLSLLTQLSDLGNK